MKVQCVMCGNHSQIDDDLPLAKKLRNRPIHTYMCQECNERIKIKTEARHASGNFHLYQYDTKNSDF